MSAINTGSFSRYLWPGAKLVWGAAYKEYPEEYSQIFTRVESDKSYEEYLGYSGFGLAPQKPEGSAISFDTAQQGFVTRLTNVAYALGFVITREMWKDNQYATPLDRRARALARSMRQTKETVAANVLNRATNASYTGGDSVTLLNTAHPRKAGGTYANKLTTDADLSEAALEQASIDIAGFTDDCGLKIAAKPRKLVIPKELMFEAERILKSIQRVDTANNDINALRSMNVFPEGVAVNHYLTDSDAWFVLTDIPGREGLIYQEREADKFFEADDSDTLNAKFFGYGRYAFGWVDPRAIYGSVGS